MKKSQQMKKSKPILFATLGFPGSGKTFFARKFCKEFGIFHLNSDRLRFEIFLKPTYSAKENEAVFRAMDFIAEELLSRGVSVVYDANSTRRIYRVRLRKIARKYKAGYALLWFQVSLKTALDRIRKRGELKRELLKKYHVPLSEQILFRIKRKIEEPRKEPCIALDGEKSYKEQKKVLRKYLRG